ncbi:MAG: hypothetical protein JXB33_01845 [Clostridia bacterium]|nr:hypothetical protein [Clostridia bacterium]
MKMTDSKEIKPINQTVPGENTQKPEETVIKPSIKPRADMRFRVRREDLVKGIILKEILGPPKAFER